ncbi:hypothetical protein [Vibrio cincinnatiensis]|jgi:hypothetical protein|uniref:Uncharacterized protein n=1 Tax=Vibrio cincinnatiensis DSM 19608 TaxID=1123491 RepID=A0A1T4SGW3_VIBCI|nr:hypothetical protein [Vibrio cincinnatiensis]MCG3723964.1 hypothetical protein [Vibrio cincinnatiensis]MCG3727488.1 hypothetical protein [Vibrio cincinnatiensis]MCG3737861.1 hypothetical protein [Vibrio cincinnatiensis]MCG3748531.1 hypothetical protein [Vibrio cincinnatiensis]SKA27403.1 hypothetical protein SAMN02745782_03277 [Vibrio cincinnatiensis DSM 19608]
MSIRDSIDALEQQIYVACSEGDYQTVNQLEQQLEQLRGEMEHPFDDDPYALEGRTFLDDDWR